MMRVRNPDIQGVQASSLTPYLGRILNLDLQLDKTTEILIRPGLNQNDVERICIWMKGRVWEIEDAAYTIAQTAGLGGYLDGTGAAVDTRYLFWAIANDNNTEFLGFGSTRKPLAPYTTVASGGLGSLATYGGVTNARSFSIGSTVIVRNVVGGSTPNFEWNQGVVTGSPTELSLTVQMDSNLNGSTAITKVTGEIEQLNRFSPWAGDIGSDAPYSESYRLIGEGLTDATKSWIWLRRTDETWQQILIQYPTVTFNAASQTTDYFYWRYLPTWSRRMGVLNSMNCVAAVSLIRMEWYIPRSTTVSNLVAQGGASTFGGTLTGHNAEAEIGWGEGRVVSLRGLGVGNVNTIHKLISVQDGGLRE